jgi:hypothetical protein
MSASGALVELALSANMRRSTSSVKLPTIQRATQDRPAIVKGEEEIESAPRSGIFEN